jgi:ornithine carbamoyltransferase
VAGVDQKNWKAFRLRGLRRRWILNTVLPVSLVLIIVVALFSVGISSYYFGSMQKGLETRAQAVANSFAEWVLKGDYELVITHPEGYELDEKFTCGATIEYDQRKAFEGADFIYAKNWSAYSGENYGKVLSTDKDWTVDAEKMALTNNAFFMHCLPVRRNMIVTDEVIEAPTSLVIPEAANREISATVVLKRILENI